MSDTAEFLMVRTGTPRTEPLQVCIVSDSDETLLGLRDYLSGAGVAVSATRTPSELSERSRPMDAVILFPDDFPSLEVKRALAALARRTPPTLALIVTGDPRRVATWADAERSLSASVVIGKPAWGWTILDILRGQLEA